MRQTDIHSWGDFRLFVQQFYLSWQVQSCEFELDKRFVTQLLTLQISESVASLNLSSLGIAFVYSGLTP